MQEYKYLGLLFDKYVTFNDSIKMLVESAGRALGAIAAKFKHTKNKGSWIQRIYKTI